MSGPGHRRLWVDVFSFLEASDILRCKQWVCKDNFESLSTLFYVLHVSSSTGFNTILGQRSKIRDFDEILRVLSQRFFLARICDLHNCEVSHSSAMAIASHCQQVRILRLRLCRGPSTLGIAAIAQNCPLLHVDISYCCEVTDDWLLALSRHATHLRVCILTKCKLVTDVGISALAVARGLQLLELNVAGCDLLTDATLSALAGSCSCLEMLNIRWCWQLIRCQSGIADIVRRCPSLTSLVPAELFNELLFRTCVDDDAQAERLRLRLECGRCGEVMYASLDPRKVMIGPGSQAHLANEVYTDVAPDRMGDLCDVTSRWSNKPRTMHNCPKNCHATSTSTQWLVDSGSGMISMRKYRYALACGDDFVKVKWVSSSAPQGRGLVESVKADASVDVDHYATRYLCQHRSTASASSFYGQLFTACGKIPDVPNTEALLRLLESGEFTGCADDYVDAKGSTLLMYCVGPANSETLAMVQILVRHGADPTHRNDDRRTAMAFVKAWRQHQNHLAGLYDDIAAEFIKAGCDPHEAPAF